MHQPNYAKWAAPLFWPHAHGFSYCFLTEMHTPPLPRYLSIKTLPLIQHRKPGGSVVKNLPANAGAAGDTESVSRLGRSAGEGNGNPLQYSFWDPCIEEWGLLVHGWNSKELDTSEAIEHASALIQHTWNIGVSLPLPLKKNPDWSKWFTMTRKRGTLMNQHPQGSQWDLPTDLRRQRQWILHLYIFHYLPLNHH